MILALDVGNSNIVAGCIDEGKTTFVSRFSTDVKRTDDEYAIGFKNMLELFNLSPHAVDGAIISSVVPPLTLVLKSAIQKITGRTALVVGPGIKTGLNIIIDNPGQLGSDLVVGAVAAIEKYEKPIISFDIGTATTVSVIDENSNYLGGIIAAGVMIGLHALTTNTSQLPRISLEAPKKLICGNTIDCMKSGVIYGNAAMIDGLIDRIQKQFLKKATVVATGGLAPFLLPYCVKGNYFMTKTFYLTVLYMIYNKNR